MSFVLTSNRLNENHTSSERGEIPIENPSNFKNFFRSPVIIPPNSEIAVQSVKIERSGNVELADDTYLCHYWGRDPQSLPDYEEREYLNGNARTISFKAGSYNLLALPKHIQERFRAQYAHPNLYGGEEISVKTGSGGIEQGLNFKFTAKGSASVSGSNNVSASLVATPVYNLALPGAANAAPPAPSDQYNWTPGTGVISRTGASTDTFSNASCVVMLKGRPFGLSQGKFDVTTAFANSERWAVGLSRPQIQFYETKSAVAGEDAIDLDADTYGHHINDRTIVEPEGPLLPLQGPFETYDYAVIRSETDEIMVVQRAWDEEDEKLNCMEEIKYWEVPGSNASVLPGGGARTGRMTLTEFSASYDGVRFEGAGDEIKLYFKQTGKTTYDTILDSDLSDELGKCYTPIGDTSYALYPMFNLGNGSMGITKYQSNYIGTDDSYKFPTYDAATRTYIPGSDMFSNEAPTMKNDILSTYSKPEGRSLITDDVVLQVDSSWTKINWASGEQTLPNYAFTGLLNASNQYGINYVHSITLGPFEIPDENNTLIESQKFPDSSLIFGFPDRAILLQEDGGVPPGYVSGNDTRVVTFASTHSLEKINKSAFIRVPNLTHNSYNGTQSSISKILYQIPQFTNDGRQYGPLFFEPGEKTYIKLNNTSTMTLNHLEIQIVEANEKVIDSLTYNGTTQIVFHIK